MSLGDEAVGGVGVHVVHVAQPLGVAEVHGGGAAAGVQVGLVLEGRAVQQDVVGQGGLVAPREEHLHVRDGVAGALHPRGTQQGRVRERER